MNRQPSTCVCVCLALLGSALPRPALADAPPPASEARWFAREWQSEDGLPENSITGVTQARDGYIWVSTQHALARFDGVRFLKAALPNARSSVEPSIHALLAATGDELWVVMEGGVVMSLSPRATNVFTTTSGLPMGRPMVSDQDGSGAVWVAYADGSVCRIAQGKVERFDSQHGLSGDGPCWLAADVDGQIWFAKAGRVGVFRSNQFVSLINLGRAPLKLCAAREGGLWICAGLDLWRHTPGQEPIKAATLEPPRTSASTRVMLEDRTGAVWIGTAAGLFRYDTFGVTAVATSHPDITDLAEDREGNIWAGTRGGGLNRIRPGVVSIESPGTGLPFSTVRSICSDASGSTWAVSQVGTVWQKSGAEWQINNGQGAWQSGRATCVCPSANGGVWIGTQDDAIHRWINGKVLTLSREHGLEGGSVRALLLSSNGDLWISQEKSNGVQRLRNNLFTTFPLPVESRPVRAIAEDVSGNIWMGTVGGHLFRTSGDKLADVTPPLPRRPIRCLYTTPDGSIWIGYAGMGIGRIKNGSFSHAAVSNGLHDEFVSQIAADAYGSLWIGADHGIFEVRQRELEEVMDGRLERVRSMVYGRDEGLPSLQAEYGHWPVILREPSGVLWFPMRTGLARIRPEPIRTSHVPPPVRIEGVLLDGRTLHPQQEHRPSPGDPTEQVFSVRPNHRRLEISFTALSFVAPDKVHFKHQLQGLDDEWSAPATTRTVSYPRLPHGTYRFVLTACNQAGVWNPAGTAMTLVVSPFYWQTWWFRSAAFLSSALLIVGLVRFASFRSLQRRLSHLERETAVQQERARIAKDIHDDLGASLTQIALLGDLARDDRANPEKLESHVNNIAATARSGVKSLEEIVWAVNPRNDTLAHLLGYVGQYAVDFLQSARIRCRIDFPEQLPDLTVPSDLRHNLFLAAKEALNNVARHAGATEVWLRASISNRSLCLAIEDNGRGFHQEQTNRPGNGLRNLQQRLTEVGGVCNVQSAPGHGTRVRIEVSLKR